MDLYITTLALGAVGLLAMALGGLVRDAHGGHASHGSSGHASDGHGGHGGHSGHGGHGGHAGHVAHADHAGHAGQPAHHGHSAHGHGAKDGGANVLLTLMSPRVLFSVSLGVGATGLLLRPLLGGGVPLLAGALVGGVLFERFIVTPVWNFIFRFASTPALTLESALQGEATAVTAFDANGQGLIAVEVDGRLVQLLGTLQPADRELRVRVVAGARLRIEDVDAARNRCTVSLQ